MSNNIFDWFRKKLGISPQTHIDLPSEFQLSNKNDADYIGNDSINNFVRTDHFTPNLNDTLEENMNIMFSSFEKLFDQMGFDFETFNSDQNNSNIFYVSNNGEDGNLDQSSVEKHYNKIPKKNYVARDYFLNPGLTSRNTWSDSPVRVEMSPHFTSQTSSSKSYYSSQWNGKKIEKEVSTKQLPDGTTQKVTVMKEGDKKIITTVDILSGRQQNFKKELYNLDESQLDEFEKLFSKF